MPKVSIITAAFVDTEEKKDWLREAIQSVLAQSFTDWEMIVIDDGSPIGLAELQDSGDSRFRWLRSAGKQGPALTRNSGVALARAEAILALDADDQLTPTAIEMMWAVWETNPSQIVYGDLQRLERQIDQTFKPGRIFDLPEYTFDRAIDPRGIIPVTAMHSIECHEKAGGWKPELEAGLEDVEKWIAAGKAGFCGKRVPGVTLLYRQHPSSRAFALRRINRRETEMRDLIRHMHSDVYEGRYPVGCCGGKGRTNNTSSMGSSVLTAQGFAIPASRLDQVPANEKVWVQYNGNRTASFGLVGQGTGIHYTIAGRGHKFEAHVSDLGKFRHSGRGQDFSVGVPAPDDAPKPEPEKAEEAYVASTPQLAILERLDRIAVER